MFDLKRAACERHSVRKYTDAPIEGEKKETLLREIEAINAESGLHIQFVTDEPKAFSGFMAHYGTFSGVKNYFALVGKDDKDLEEKCGYYGEKLVLIAQSLGLNTCWVYLTFKKIKDAFVVDTGEKLCLVISVGYGETQGVQHKNKTLEKLADLSEDDPDWYVEGVTQAQRLTPTAINQQKYHFFRRGKEVMVKIGLGPCVKIDLGIVKFTFELFAGKENFHFVDHFSN